MPTTHITAPTLDALRARRDEIIALCERHGATNVRVFGSVARGEATPDSGCLTPTRQAKGYPF
jgi:hypothetical protein